MTRFVSPVLLVALLVPVVAAPPLAGQAPAAPSSAEDLQALETTLGFVRQRHARDYAITTPNGVDEARFVDLGGIPQWITIRGEDRSNPVVLFLHGGPGDATNPWGYAVFRPWLRAFTVVQWDQRGAGRTLGRSGPGIAPTITIDRLAQDGVELAEWLIATLKTPKIVLVGHSWGSILAIFMARSRPELFAALVGTGQVADPAASYTVAHAALVAKAAAIGDRRAARELQEVGPPPYADGRGYAVQRKWSNVFEGADVFLSATLGLALGAPGSRVRDVNDWLEGQGLSAGALVPQTSALTASRLAGEFRVPVFVIQGAEDFTTPTSLARRFVDAITAPAKEFVTIDGGHFAVFMKPEAFVAALQPRVQRVWRAP